jgi:hypothetical protein
MPYPKDLTDTGKERQAIAEAVVDEVERRHQTGSTPPPASPASISQTEMEAIAMKACEKCHMPGGVVWGLWEEIKPIRSRVWMITGALVLLGAMMTYTMPRINAKLDALDDMAKDMAALKVQINFLIGNQHGSLESTPTTIAQGVTP